MSKIQVLIGHVASGKSTYCKKAARKGYIILNDDEIVTLLHGGDYTLYSHHLKPLYKSIECHILATALAMNRVVVVDRGLNISTQGRQRWIALAKSFDVPVEALVFANEGPEIHAKRRFNHDSRGHSLEYWMDVAKAHQARYSIPTEAEGFDRIHFYDYGEEP